MAPFSSRATESEPTARIYRLYIPPGLQVVLALVLGLFSALAVFFLAVLRDPEAKRIGILWLLAVGLVWYRVLSIPYRIETSAAAGPIAFVSLLRRTQTLPQSIVSIRPGAQFGFYVLKHGSGRILLLGQFDGWHEFIAWLKGANPAVQLRGC